MPLKLRDPTPGKTPNYHIRGTHRGIYVERTTGTSDKRKAQAVLNSIREQIERGDYSPAPEAVSGPQAEPATPTFAAATLAYLKANGDPSYLGDIIDMTGPHALRDKLITAIDQVAIDNAAAALYPDAPAATRNRQFYTPVSAVLKRAGVEMKIKRPKGWRGNRATEWLEPDQAFAVIEAAFDLELEFGLLCLAYLYTGRRMSDFLNARLRHLKLEQSLIYLPDTKNGEPVPVHLPPVLVQAFREQPARKARARGPDGKKLLRGVAAREFADVGVPFLERHPDAKLFRFHAGGRLRDLLKAALKRARVVLPKRQAGFHIFCHTYGTWMHRYGSLDNFGLTRTGRWKDPASANRYMHTKATEEARRSDLLPIPEIRFGRGMRKDITKSRGKAGETRSARKKA